MIRPVLTAITVAISLGSPLLGSARAEKLHWHSNYTEAMQAARRAQRMMLILFQGPANDPLRKEFQQKTLTDKTVLKKLKRFTLVKLPLDAKIKLDGKQVRLLDNKAFADMYGRQGVAIIDMSDEKSEHFRGIVSEFPFSKKFKYDARRMSVILDLPPGSLTQRTMVYAVRMHPDQPKSTEGKIHTELLSEARKHSFHQASIQLQGHHNWDTRFHRINAKLPAGLMSVEVCAESWPGEELVEAAIECVHCWRQSSGHWRAVRARHNLFGYDMRRGRNRIWYATGIFGSR